jgi:hypothetical protein
MFLWNIGNHQLCNTVSQPKDMSTLDPRSLFSWSYCTQDQTVHFAYITSLWVEVKQTHILCKPKTLSTQEMRQQVTKYCCWEMMFMVWTVYASYLLPHPPLWSPCLLLLMVLRCTDSPDQYTFECYPSISVYKRLLAKNFLPRMFSCFPIWATCRNQYSLTAVKAWVVVLLQSKMGDLLEIKEEPWQLDMNNEVRPFMGQCCNNCTSNSRVSGVDTRHWFLYVLTRYHQVYVSVYNLGFWG